MKTRFINLGIGLLALGVSSAWAQEYKVYDIGTYRLPDITRNELDFSLHSEGSFNDYTGTDGVGSFLGGDFEVSFNRYRNARSFRGTHNAAVSFSGDYNKTIFGEKRGDYSLGLFYSNSSRFYGDDYEGLFFETGGAASFSMAGDKIFGAVEEEERNTFKKVTLSIPLRVGKGRIERVEDARQAIYILENLSKRKVLNRKLTDEEIDEFARLISTVKNKRFFDARLRMIDEVTAVDSFLVRSGALTSGGASYFTTLYDYWMYGDLFKRKSGTEISGGVRPGFVYDASDSPDPSFHRNRLKEASILADISFDYEKPLSLYWQNSASAYLSGCYSRRDEQIKDHLYNELEYKRDDYAARLGGRYAFGYYPNSRTNINLGIEEVLGWDKSKWDDPAAEPQSYVSTNTSLTLDLYYYFSPQLRLAAEGRLIHCYKGDGVIDHYTRWQGNFVLTLTYSLF
ncbi:hypothetical protein [Parabacteroides distasonis]|uniref:Uncharacterized protein n=1 Tax=Parabacteroides distasonis TaxID=823 RepID=A0A3L7ZLG8_PARDI|nr:hypothetical protein [Parabacteroides distasonis]NBH89904.1 hypothetical protein [Parabacteroides distasonis]RLT72754.1 hypothetical protein D7V78_14010 [Parabacteroides distasonis]